MTVTVIGDNTGDDFSGTEDTYIRKDAAATNFGSATLIKVTKFSAAIHAHSLLSFSGLSNISASETVSASTLYQYVTGTSVPASTTATVRRILPNWVEAQATWNIYSTGNNWTTAGCLSDGNDRSGTSTGTFALDSTGYQSMATAQLITDTQNFIDGTWANYGWHEERTDTGEDSTATDIISSEGTDGQRPYISVTHAASGSTPKNRTFNGPLAGPFNGPF